MANRYFVKQNGGNYGVYDRQELRQNNPEKAMVKDGMSFDEAWAALRQINELGVSSVVVEKV